MIPTTVLIRRAAAAAASGWGGLAPVPGSSCCSGGRRHVSSLAPQRRRRPQALQLQLQLLLAPPPLLPPALRLSPGSISCYSSSSSSSSSSQQRPRHTDLHPPKPSLAHRLVASAPASVQPYLRLARLDRPIGTWLLYLPCTWSITMATPSGLLPDPLVLGLFGVGAVLMRGAGCTMNDILDRDFDKRVERTEGRPIPSGAVSVPKAAAFMVGQSLLAACVLFQFDWFTIGLGVASLGLVATYPLFKRVTYWPQAVLGLTFNYGALLGYSALTGGINPAVCLPLYAAGFCWTLAYDTIYAHQDKEDDLIVGVKSTALLFGDQTKTWLIGFNLGMAALLATAGINAECGLLYHMGAMYAVLHMANQIRSVDLRNPADCLAKFKSNRNLGIVFLLAIVLDNFIGIPVPGAEVLDPEGMLEPFDDDADG